MAFFAVTPNATHAQAVPDGRTATTVTGSGANSNVHTQTISQGHGINSFSSFNVGVGASVNIHAPTGTAGTVNIVNGPASQIQGAVRGMQNGAVGGAMYFANPNGVVIGPSGSMSAGSVSVSTPTQGFVDGFIDGNGQVRAGHVQQTIDGTSPQSGASVDVHGRVEGYTGVRIRAGGDVNIWGEVTSGSRSSAAQGHISLKVGGSVNVNQGGRVDARAGAAGGTVSMRAGADINVYAGSVVLAEGEGHGGGGTIDVFAEGAARLKRDAVVSAAALGSGNGGFIEFSALSGLAAEEDQLNDEIGEPRVYSDELERHFLRAFSILEKLGRTDDDSLSIEALIEVNSQPSMLVRPDGEIAAVNKAAREMLGVAEKDSITVLALDVDGVANLRASLASMATQPSSRLLAIARVSLSPSSPDLVLALSRAQRPEGAAPMGLLTVADLTWTMRVGEVLARSFGLTETEFDIVRALVSGESVRQIAEVRSRAIDTVRTQAKSVLRKVNVRSQGELLRLTAALVQIDLRGGEARPPDLLNEGAEPIILLRPGGRRLRYALIGPEDGRPVLFLHGMLDGHGITGYCRDELFARGIRLVAPVRPHFGASDPDGGAKGAPERFARDVEALVDQLGVGRFSVIGHMAGSIYAFACANHLADRVTGIVNVSGGVPIVSHAQFAMMTPRQRIVAYTARYTPTLLPLILRAGIALLDNGGDHAFMKALYENAPVDHQVARRPDVFPILSRGYRFTVAQGHGAFEIDSRQVTSDWSRYVEGCSHPFTLVHGHHDPVVRISTVRDFARRYQPRAKLVEVEDQGQLLFYARPDIVLDALSVYA